MEDPESDNVLTDQLAKLGLPVKRHPSKEMAEDWVAKYIEARPQEFELLQQLIAREADLAAAMTSFFKFLEENKFDEKYSEGEIFSSLCVIAESRSTKS
jgi:hypothetical protein